MRSRSYLSRRIFRHANFATLFRSGRSGGPPGSEPAVDMMRRGSTREMSGSDIHDDVTAQAVLLTDSEGLPYGWTVEHGFGGAPEAAATEESLMEGPTPDAPIRPSITDLPAAASQSPPLQRQAAVKKTARPGATQDAGGRQAQNPKSEKEDPDWQRLQLILRTHKKQPDPGAVLPPAAAHDEQAAKTRPSDQTPGGLDPEPHDQGRAARAAGGGSAVEAAGPVDIDEKIYPPVDPAPAGQHTSDKLADTSAASRFDPDTTEVETAAPAGARPVHDDHTALTVTSNKDRQVVSPVIQPDETEQLSQDPGRLRPGEPDARQPNRRPERGSVEGPGLPFADAPQMAEEPDPPAVGDREVSSPDSQEPENKPGPNPPALEQVWPVQRRVSRAEKRPPLAGADRPELEAARRAGSSETGLVQTREQSEKGRTRQADGEQRTSIEIIGPRRPRPEIEKLATSGGQRRSMKSSREAAADAEESPFEEIKGSSDEKGSAANRAVETDIGALPADLWQLLDRDPPMASSVERATEPARQKQNESAGDSKVSAAAQKAESTVQRSKAGEIDSPRTPDTPRSRSELRQTIEIDPPAALQMARGAAEQREQESNDSDEDQDLAEELDVALLARRVLPVIKRMLNVERERRR